MKGLATPFQSTTAKPGSWDEFVRVTTMVGIKKRDLVSAYDAIIAEGERREYCVDRFIESRNHMTALRRMKAERRRK